MKCLVVFGPKAEVLSALYADETFQNWKLVLVGRNLEKLDESLRRQTSFGEIISIETDYLKLATSDDYLTLAKALAEHLVQEPEGNFFVFAQGVIGRSLFFLQTDDQISNQLKVNLEFPVRCTHAIIKTAPNLLSAHWYYLSSIATQRSDVGVSLYASTKSALEKFCETLRLEQKLVKKPGTMKVLRIILIDGGLSQGLPDEMKNELQQLAVNSKFTSKSALANYLIGDFGDPDADVSLVE